MDAIALLMDEHQLILRVLDSLEVFAASVEEGVAGPGEELGRFVRFIREFADTHHHCKEEDILFSAMVRAGFPGRTGPIAVMLAEHDAGRAHAALMAEKATAAAWPREVREAIVDAARGYAGLLRSHIAKEDQLLYPMARQHLDAEGMHAVDLACERHETRAGQRVAELRALGAELAKHPTPKPA